MSRKRGYAISCLAVLLTLAASGDDINVARLALPTAFASAPVGSFPLDDENTDFLKPAELRLVECQRPDPLGHRCMLADPFQQRPAALSSRLHPCADRQYYLSNGSELTPLRC